MNLNVEIEGIDSLSHIITLYRQIKYLYVFRFLLLGRQLLPLENSSLKLIYIYVWVFI
jgi:hypothetical protein